MCFFCDPKAGLLFVKMLRKLHFFYEYCVFFQGYDNNCRNGKGQIKDNQNSKIEDTSMSNNKRNLPQNLTPDIEERKLSRQNIWILIKSFTRENRPPLLRILGSSLTILGTGLIYVLDKKGEEGVLILHGFIMPIALIAATSFNLHPPSNTPKQMNLPTAINPDEDKDEDKTAVDPDEDEDELE